MLFYIFQVILITLFQFPKYSILFSHYLIEIVNLFSILKLSFNNASPLLNLFQISRHLIMAQMVLWQRSRLYSIIYFIFPLFFLGKIKETKSSVYCDSVKTLNVNISLYLELKWLVTEIIQHLFLWLITVRVCHFHLFQFLKFEYLLFLCVRNYIFLSCLLTFYRPNNLFEKRIIRLRVTNNSQNLNSFKMMRNLWEAEVAVLLSLHQGAGNHLPTVQAYHTRWARHD